MRRLSKRLSLHRRDVLSNDVVSFKGVALEVLEHVALDVQSETLAPGVELFACLEDVSRDVLQGDTLRLEERPDDSEDGAGASSSGFWPFTSTKWRFSSPWGASDVWLAPGKVAKKERVAWTVEDVNQYVVVEVTRDKACKFLETLGKKEQGSSFTGAFLSCAHGSNFADVVAAVAAHMGPAGTNLAEEERFVWWDIFCANQHVLKLRGQQALTARKVQYLLESSLLRAIDRFGDRVVFFDAWQDGLPLQRAWCVWEMYNMVGAASNSDAGRPLALLMPPQADAALLDALAGEGGGGGFEDVRSGFEGHDARRAVSRDALDAEMIHAILADQDGGYTTVNGVLVTAVREALLERLRVAVDARRQEAVLAAPSDSDAFYSVELAELLTQAGLLMSAESFHEQAMAYLREALKASKAVHGPEDIAVARVLGHLGNALVLQAAPLEQFKALAFFEEGYNLTKKALSPNHVDVTICLNDWASLLEDMELFEEATEKFMQALTIRRANDEHPEEEAMILSNIGSLHFRQGQNASALQYTEEAMALYTSIDQAHAALPQLLCNLAVIHHAMGDSDQAMVELHRAEQMADTGDVEVKMMMANMLQDAGELDEAQTYYQAAYDTIVETHGSRDEAAATLLNYMGSVLAEQSAFDRAIALYQEALDIRREIFSESHPLTGMVLFNMAAALEATGNIEAAIEQSILAHDIYKRTCGADNPDTLDARHQLLRLKDRFASGLERSKQKDQAAAAAAKKGPSSPRPAARNRKAKAKHPLRR